MDARETQPATTRARWLRRLGAPLRSVSGMLRAAYRRPLLRGLVTALMLASIIGLATAWTFVRSAPKRKDFRPAIARMFAAYDALDFPSARRLATELRSAELTFEELGTPVFVLGATLAHDAAQESNPEQRKLQYLIASRYLEEARDRSFPASHAVEAKLLLGLSLYESGRYSESVPVLTEALKQHRGRRSQLLEALARAEFSREMPRLDEAQRHVDTLLRDKTLPDIKRIDGLYLKAEIALARDAHAECRDAATELLKLGESLRNAPPAERRRRRARLTRDESRLLQQRMAQALALNARIQIAEADRMAAAGDATDETRAELTELLGRTRDELTKAHEDQLTSAESELLLGMVLRRLGDTDAALAQLRRAAERYYSMPAGLAAELERAELLADSGKATEALGYYERVFDTISERRDQRNPWVTHERLQASALKFYANALSSGRFADAVAIAKALDALASPEEVLLLRGDAFERWGEAQLQQAATSPFTKARELRSSAKKSFQQAADCFSQLAELRFATSFYLTDLWRSAENYLRANDYRRAQRIVSRYLDQEPRRLRARALTLLGEARLLAGDTQGALEALDTCIAAYPRDPDSYRARVLAARAWAESGNIEQSKLLLLQNLEQDALTPRSADWRESLFDLGALLHREGTELAFDARQSGLRSGDAQRRRAAMRKLEAAGKRFEEAAERLLEATRRYPEDPRAFQARYLLADSYRNLARIPRDQLASETISSRRSDLVRDMRGLLEKAYEHYNNLANELADRRDRTELTPVDAAILRNCYFIRGHVLFDLERYPEAIEAYSDASNRYQHDPSALEAYQQIAACYRLLDDAAKARGAMEQARVVFSNLPTDVDYRRTTRFSREGWAELLQ